MEDQEKVEVAINTEKGIKETLEFIAGLGVAVPAAVEILADKKLSAKDIKPVIEAIKQHEVVVAAVKNADEILGEAKDYSMEELAQLGGAVLKVFHDSKEAYARGK